MGNAWTASANSSQHRNPRLMKLRMMPITIMVVGLRDIGLTGYAFHHLHGAGTEIANPRLNWNPVMLVVCLQQRRWCTPRQGRCRGSNERGNLEAVDRPATAPRQEDAGDGGTCDRAAVWGLLNRHPII